MEGGGDNRRREREREGEREREREKERDRKRDIGCVQEGVHSHLECGGVTALMVMLSCVDWRLLSPDVGMVTTGVCDWDLSVFIEHCC